MRKLNPFFWYKRRKIRKFFAESKSEIVEQGVKTLENGEKYSYCVIKAPKPIPHAKPGITRL
jgi:hypothetical protein